MKQKIKTCLQKIGDILLQPYCYARLTSHPVSSPQRITANALRRTRHLATHPRYGQVLSVIHREKYRARREENGTWPPNPTGVHTAIGENRFRRLWKKHAGNSKEIARVTGLSTPSLAAYARELRLKCPAPKQQ